MLRLLAAMTGMLVGLWLTAGPLVAEDVGAVYEQTYGVRESRLGTIQQKIAFADDLIRAADGTTQAAMAELLYRKAHEVAAGDIESFPQAAEALCKLQCRKPQLRAWCLQALVELYDTAYSEHPSHLDKGERLGSALLELARQRLQDAEAAAEAGAADPPQVAAAAGAAHADAARAWAVYKRVFGHARAKLQAAVHLQNLASVKRLNAFIDAVQPLKMRAERERKRFAEAQANWTGLVKDHALFEADPGAATAQRLAGCCLLAFDRPELITAEVASHLPASVQRPIELACQPVNTLGGEQAASLANWYLNLCAQAQTDAARDRLLGRATLYAGHAAAQGSTHAAAIGTRLAARINGQASSADAIEEQAEALRLRLKYRSERSAVARGRGAHVPADALAAADKADEHPHGIDATSGRHAVAALPMTTCSACGRRFFAGWGVQAEVCSDCGREGGSVFHYERR